MGELEKYCVFIRNGANIKNSKEQSGVPITRIETISDGTIDKEKMGYADIFDDRYKEYYLQKDDILMSHINSMKHLGKFAYCNINMDVIHGMNLLNIRANSSKIYPKYLYYYFKSNDFKIKLNKISKQSVNQSSFAVNDLKKIKIKIMDKITQKEIVYKLDKIVDIISLRKNQIKLFENIIKSQFVEMFGDPILNNKNWKISKWNEVLTIKNGKSQKKVEQENGQYPIYGSGGIMSYANDYICNENSVIIGRKGNINNPILVRTKFWNVDTAFGLEPCKEKMIVEYLYYFCYFYNFEKHNKAVTIPSLTKTDLLNIYIPIPPIDLQNQFAEIVKQIDKQKFEIENSLKEMQELYESLMEKYFG